METSRPIRLVVASRDSRTCFLRRLCWCALTLAVSASAAVTVTLPRCEYADQPLGLDSPQPRLSWVLESNERAQRQSAYQILVASSADKLQAGQADLWDSGKLASDQSIQVVYAGQPLASRQRCFWRVHVWDQDGKLAESTPTFWEMGLLQPTDWQAQWIGFSTNTAAQSPFEGARWIWFPEGNPAANAPKGERYFRRVVQLPADVGLQRATLALTVDDQFTLFVNGEEVGKSSGQTDAWKGLSTFNLKSRLRTGPNVIAVKAFNDASAAGLLARLDIECSPGPQLAFVSDKSWKVADAPAEGWNREQFDDTNWKPAQEIAKLGEGPWGNAFSGQPTLGQVPHLRKITQFTKPIKQARLYASALGVYEFYLNGQRVSHDVFNPSWTDYKKRVQYHTYDVTGLLRAGNNAFGIILGDGWYAGYVGLGGPQRYGPQALALAQLEVEFADGTRQTIATDNSWKAANGPLLQSDMLMGETYDARRELPGWSTVGFDDSTWQSAQTKKVEVLLVAAPDAPVRPMMELKPRAITEPTPGHFIFDLGQNMVGWARLKVRGQAGTTVTLKFVEMLNPDGTIYTANLRGAKCTDYYTLKGGGEEVWEPRFTFHGFRYVELTGFPGKPELEAVTGVVTYSDTPPVGTFECSNPLVNQLYRNIVWGQRGNFLAVPTDCPQRDERLGWMGDAQIFIRTASYNMDVSRFFTKWCQDVEDAQRPDGSFTDVVPFVCCGSGVAAWGDAGVICPWTIYQVYGDTRILERHYAAGARWIEYLAGHSKNLLRPAEGYGDWLSIQADTPKDVLATAYFGLSTKIMANMAKVLGKSEDAAKYEALCQQIKTAFNQAYVAGDVRIKGNTQTDYVLALAFDLLPPEQRAAAAKHLVTDIAAKGDHLSTGFVGVGHLTPTLTRAGYTDVAYKLLLQETFPGWLYSVKNGATTIWERWDGWTKEKGFQDPGMNSFNHYSMGSVGEWMFDTVAGLGLDPERPAYKHILIRPRPGGGLAYAKAEFQSIHGKIVSDWKIENSQFRLRVVIPANTTADVFLLAASAEVVRESGQPVKSAAGVTNLRQVDGDVVISVGSGSYVFTAPAK
jgi:alpha-L-rhamnosidase